MKPKAISNTMVRNAERKYIVFRPKFLMYLAAKRVATETNKKIPSILFK